MLPHRALRAPIEAAAVLFFLIFGVAKAAAQEVRFWNDERPEVVIGIYFDAAGTDSMLEGEVPDTIVAYVFMDNASLRGEGNVQGLEYALELPDGIELITDALPKYTNLTIGGLRDGFTQAILDKSGDHLLINTLTLRRSGEVPYDARLRIVAHPKAGKLQYAAGWPMERRVSTHLMEARDGILNPKVAATPWKPVLRKD